MKQCCSKYQNKYTQNSPKRAIFQRSFCCKYLAVPGNRKEKADNIPLEEIFDFIIKSVQLLCAFSFPNAFYFSSWPALLISC